MIEKKQRNMVVSDRRHGAAVAWPHAHLVQFYDEEDHLHNVLLDYFTPFFTDGDSWLGAIVLARPQTTGVLRDYLLAKGYLCDGTIDISKQRRSADGDCATAIGAVYMRGQRKLLLLDADMVLESLVREDQLDGEQFDNLLNELSYQLSAEYLTGSYPEPHRQEPPIYAYGELVDILCARGQHLLALELEALWNRFLAAGTISLLCGYKMESFRDLQTENLFEQICHSHTAVTPTEMYSSLATTEQKLAVIVALQQKVASLQWSRAKAEQQIRYREQFMDTLCHELRNPVSGIVGNVELLQQGLDVRQAILCPYNGSRDHGNLQLSSEDIESLRTQLSSDLESIDAIAACAEYMKTVSDDVLSLSKLENGKVTLEKVPFDPKVTITSVLKMFSTLARKKGLQLVEDFPIDNFSLIGDSGRLAQVIMNLVSNALKFTEVGRITVQLRSLSTSVNGGDGSSVLKIAVCDSGRGLSQDEISILFQRFAQPPSTSFAKDGGSGLGLFISKYLVELMGGAMHVESQCGKGSAFIFTFLAEQYSSISMNGVIPRQLFSKECMETPLVKLITSHNYPGSMPQAVSVPYRPMPYQTIVDSSTSTTMGEQHPMVGHILLVDDNPIILRILTRIFESVSSSMPCISTASNGYEAISRVLALNISSSPVELILMDLDMPFMDGLRAASEIRRLASCDAGKGRSVAEEREASRLADIPIIGLTGHAREERFAEAKRNGMDECVQKPVDRAILIQLIEKIIRNRRNGTSNNDKRANGNRPQLRRAQTSIMCG